MDSGIGQVEGILWDTGPVAGTGIYIQYILANHRCAPMRQVGYTNPSTSAPRYYNFAPRPGAVTNFSNPALICALIAVLVRARLSTETCVYPPTAAGVSAFPPEDLNTPTSYVTELLPRCETRRPRSRTSGKDSGEKNYVCDELNT